MLRNRRLDLVVAATAVALLAVSFAPWERDFHGTDTNVWHAPAAVGGSIVVALLSAALWLARPGRVWRLAASAGAVGSAVWFLCYTRLEVPGAFVTSEAGWTFYAGARPPKLTAAGSTWALPVGSVLVAGLAVLMVAAVGAELVRHPPTADERRQAAVVVPVVAAVAVLALGFAPWWWGRGTTIVTADAWSASTVWSICLGATVVALGVWVLVRTPAARIVATALAVTAAAAAGGYLATRPTRPPAGGPRRYVDYLPPSPFHRDVLFTYDGSSGPEVGAYVGIGLIALIAAVMLVLVVGDRMSIRGPRAVTVATTSSP